MHHESMGRMLARHLSFNLQIKTVIKRRLQVENLILFHIMIHFLALFIIPSLICIMTHTNGIKLMYTAMQLKFSCCHCLKWP